MKTKQLLMPLVAATVLLVLGAGCQQDSTAVQALEELTATQVNQAKKQNEELTSLVEQLGNCQANIAKVKEEPAIIKTQDSRVDVPTLAGEATLESLEAYKVELEKTLAAQQTALVDLRSKVDSCTQDLDAAVQAKADADEAAAAKAAEDEAAAKAEAEAEAEKEKARKRAAAERRKANQKPAAAKRNEAQGKPTSGPLSR